MLFACMGISIAAVCVPVAVQFSPRLVYNPTDSVARGWYRVAPHGSLHVGSVVLVQLPDPVAAFAAQRNYLPKGVPLLKRIGAVAPQVVCVRRGVVRIDGVAMGLVLALDGVHRPMHFWAECRALAGGELFLLSNAHAASFDSRYFGPVGASTVIGNAQPLWTWSAQ
jgi:conjugative transfer signal peptidase TraF